LMMRMEPQVLTMRTYSQAFRELAFLHQEVVGSLSR